METQAVTSMSLPPLQNLPQWPRIQTLDKARYPRPFLKDHIQVLPQPSNFHGRQYDTDTLDGTSVSGDMDPATKLAHLEKSIDFLKRHHREVLESLHEEIENLKTENKGKFKFHESANGREWFHKFFYFVPLSLSIPYMFGYMRGLLLQAS